MCARPCVLVLTGFLLMTGCSSKPASTTPASTTSSDQNATSPAPTATAKKEREWQTVQDPKGRYSVDVPGKPGGVHDSGMFVSVSGNSTVAVNVNEAKFMSLADEAAWKAFQANPGDGEAIEKLLRAHLDRVIHSLKNPRFPQDPPEPYSIVSAQRTQIGAFPGLDVVMKLDGGNRVHTRRMALTPENYFELLVNAPEPELEPETIQRIVSSFKIGPMGPPATAP